MSNLSHLLDEEVRLRHRVDLGEEKMVGAQKHSLPVSSSQKAWGFFIKDQSFRAPCNEPEGTIAAHGAQVVGGKRFSIALFFLGVVGGNVEDVGSILVAEDCGRALGGRPGRRRRGGAACQDGNHDQSPEKKKKWFHGQCSGGGRCSIREAAATDIRLEKPQHSMQDDHVAETTFFALHMPEPTVTEIARTLLAVAPLLPTVEELRGLGIDAQRVKRRGYLDAVEDEQVLGVFARYLEVRAALAEAISDLEPLLWNIKEGSREERISAFVIAYTAACLLMRSSEMLISLVADNRILHEKLDQGYPRLGLPRKQFTTVYRSRTSPYNYMRFDLGRRFATANLDEIEALSSRESLAGVVELFRREHAVAAGFSKAKSLLGGLRYRAHSWTRRRRSSVKQVTFALFELGGRSVSSLRNPLRRKAVTEKIKIAVEAAMSPGDVLVTRHADAATNLFLPGFWPHAALYLGSGKTGAGSMKLEEGPLSLSEPEPVQVLEALRDGVKFRTLKTTLAVDCFAVIRPQLAELEITEALARAATHAGKGYDFEFDFGRSDRLVCTEVIYRGFHGIGGLDFVLTERGGRPTLTAEDLLDMAIEARGFEVVALFGPEEKDGLVFGAPARERLAASY